MEICRTLNFILSSFSFFSRIEGLFSLERRVMTRWTLSRMNFCRSFGKGRDERKGKTICLTSNRAQDGIRVKWRGECR